MEYSIQLIDEPARILQVITTGEWDREADNAMGLEIMKTMAELQASKAIIDMRELQYQLKVLDFYRRVETLQEQRLKVEHTSAKVALVYRPNDVNTDHDFRFFENAAQNRGLPYRVFKQMEDALEWLAK